MNPTTDQFSNFQKLFDFFNKNLFDNELPNCMLNFSRKDKARGFFAPHRWEQRWNKQNIHEISINPASFDREPIELFSTLVHEMVHLWQQEFGKPSRTSYHNTEWSRKMISIGLMPSDTGKEGGAKTGQRVSHYVIEKGKYYKAFHRIPKSYFLPFKALESSMNKIGGKKKVDSSKIKYSCTCCGVNVWGKKGLNIICGECDDQMEEQRI